MVDKFTKWLTTLPAGAQRQICLFRQIKQSYRQQTAFASIANHWFAFSGKSRNLTDSFCCCNLCADSCCQHYQPLHTNCLCVDLPCKVNLWLLAAWKAALFVSLLTAFQATWCLSCSLLTGYEHFPYRLMGSCLYCIKVSIWCC